MDGIRSRYGSICALLMRQVGRREWLNGKLFWQRVATAGKHRYSTLGLPRRTGLIVYGALIARSVTSRPRMLRPLEEHPRLS
jgi:hypothetical protein